MTLTFDQVVTQRRSVRDFLPTPLTQRQIEQVLADAQRAPSNCNTQPWMVHIVSGPARDRLSAALLRSADEGSDRHDFGYDISHYSGAHAQRRDAQGARYYQALGIAREDSASRLRESRRNLAFFNAPHVALLFVPTVPEGDVVVAGDIGMYAQTFLLSLVSRGFAGIAQGSLSNYPATIRRELGIGAQYRLLMGIAFGYENTEALSAQVRFGRADLQESVTFHD